MKAKIDQRRHDELSQFVQQLIKARRDLGQARTDKDTAFLKRKCEALETKIDGYVYDIYGLDAAERALVEGGV
jgi:hypothetical protein